MDDEASERAFEVTESNSAMRAVVATTSAAAAWMTFTHSRCIPNSTAYGRRRS